MTVAVPSPAALGVADYAELDQLIVDELNVLALDRQVTNTSGGQLVLRYTDREYRLLLGDRDVSTDSLLAKLVGPFLDVVYG